MINAKLIKTNTKYAVATGVDPLTPAILAYNSPFDKYAVITFPFIYEYVLVTFFNSYVSPS